MPLIYNSTSIIPKRMAIIVWFRRRKKIPMHYYYLCRFRASLICFYASFPLNGTTMYISHQKLRPSRENEISFIKYEMIRSPSPIGVFNPQFPTPTYLCIKTYNIYQSKLFCLKKHEEKDPLVSSKGHRWRFWSLKLLCSTL